MELPHLVPAGRLMGWGSLKRLLHFFVLGALLAAGQHLLEDAAEPPSPTRPVLRVVVPADANDAERRDFTDEALLVQEAVRLGWPSQDRVVRDRLMRNIAFAQPELPEASRLAVALELGMAQTDPVARARLADRARRVLTQEVALETPLDADLLATLNSQRKRYTAPATVRFSQVFLDPAERGDTLADDATTLLERLNRERPAPPTALGMGDGLLIAAPVETRPAEALDRSYGKSFGQALLDLPRGEWSGPVPSTYGQHLILVHEVESARVRSLDEVRAAVTAQWRRARANEVLRVALDALLAGHEVLIVQEGAP